MGCINLIVGAYALDNSAMVYVNVINAIANFVESTPPTNNIANKTILNQYRIKQGLKIFRQKGEAAVQK